MSARQSAENDAPLRGPQKTNALIGRSLRLLRTTREIPADTATGRRWMRACDLSAAMRAAGFTNWHPQTVSNVENGRRGLTAAELFALADIFDVDPHTFIKEGLFS